MKTKSSVKLPRVVRPSQWARDAWRGRPKVEEEHRVQLPIATVRSLRRRTPDFGFGLFGAAVYYRTYSRQTKDGRQETWGDTIIRVIEGMLSIRKQWYFDHGLPWDEQKWLDLGAEMAESAFDMKWLPPGRGLWAVGTDYIYQRGSAAAYNCGFTRIDTLSGDLPWFMDALMCGVGVGFLARGNGLHLSAPEGMPAIYPVPDTKEGWVESLRLLFESYEQGSNPIHFDYSDVRPQGSPIKGFGGTASGPDSLEKLHEQSREMLDRYLAGQVSTTRLRVDLANMIGCCVVAGNARRSAEIALGAADDAEFWDLKNYEAHPERAEWGWMSNNSLLLEKTDDFGCLPAVAERILRNGEPGFVNMKNVRKFGRFGRPHVDNAEGFNPCSEIPLAHRELCDLAETYPSRCANEAELYRAMEHATTFASTVHLLATHWPQTNAIMGRNRRIGVGVSGVADWLASETWCEITRMLRRGYDRVREVNADLARDAGVPESIRVTTVKPSGTISKLAGVAPGMHHPNGRYQIRRMRVGNDAPIVRVLKEAGVPSEPDAVSENTTVFEFLINQSHLRPASEVSMWEQFTLLAALQREWSDNGVSCTIHFDPTTEGPQIEHALSAFAPVIKAISMLPLAVKSYPQMPEEEITEEQYAERLAAMPKSIDWSKLEGSDGLDDRWCNNDTCTI